MKRVKTILFLTLMLLLVLPFKIGLASPSTYAVYDVDQNFAPDSFVQIQHSGIEGRFWQTWWLIGLLVIVLGALIVGGFKLRLNAIRAEEALAKSAAEQLHQSEERFRVMFEMPALVLPWLEWIAVRWRRMLRSLR